MSFSKSLVTLCFVSGSCVISGCQDSSSPGGGGSVGEAGAGGTPQDGGAGAGGAGAAGAGGAGGDGGGTYEPPPVIDQPAPLPDGLEAISLTYDITYGGGDLPQRVRVPVDERVDASRILVLHYDEVHEQYEPAMSASGAPDGYVDFLAMDFSPYLVAKLLDAALDDFGVAQAGGRPFDVALDGFAFPNSDPYVQPFSSLGLCAGMAGHALWYFRNAATADSGLRSAYDLPDAEIVAQRATISGRNDWLTDDLLWNLVGEGGYFAPTLKASIQLLNKPQVVILRNSVRKNGHAVVAYGFTPTSFLIYDPKYPTGCEGQPCEIEFDPDRLTVKRYDGRPCFEDRFGVECAEIGDHPKTGYDVMKPAGNGLLRASELATIHDEALDAPITSDVIALDGDLAALFALEPVQPEIVPQFSFVGDQPSWDTATLWIRYRAEPELPPNGPPATCVPVEEGVACEFILNGILGDFSGAGGVPIEGALRLDLLVGDKLGETNPGYRPGSALIRVGEECIDPYFADGQWGIECTTLAGEHLAEGCIAQGSTCSAFGRYSVRTDAGGVIHSDETIVGGSLPLRKSGFSQDGQGNSVADYQGQFSPPTSSIRREGPDNVCFQYHYCHTADSWCTPQSPCCCDSCDCSYPDNNGAPAVTWGQVWALNDHGPARSRLWATGLCGTELSVCANLVEP